MAANPVPPGGVPYADVSRLLRIWAKASLRGDWYGSRSRERLPQPGDHHEVGVKHDTAGAPVDNDPAQCVFSQVR